MRSDFRSFRISVLLYYPFNSQVVGTLVEYFQHNGKINLLPGIDSALIYRML